MEKKANKGFWVASDTTKGWTLKFSFGNRKTDTPLNGVVFASLDEVRQKVKGTLVVVERKVITKTRKFFNR